MSSKRTRTNAAVTPATAPVSKTDALRQQREALAAMNAAPAAKKLSIVPPAPPSAPAVVETPVSAPAPAVSKEAKRAEWKVNSLNRKKELKALGPARIRAVRVKRASLTLAKDLRKMATWNDVVIANVNVVGEARKALETAVAQAQLAASYLEKLPAGWKPAAVAAAKAANAETGIQPGCLVAVREKFTATYEGILESNELSGLTVIALSKGVVVTKTPMGARLIFPRTHVMLVESDAAESDEEGDESFPTE